MHQTAIIEVLDDASLSQARQAARDAAEAIGFQPEAREQIVLSVTELGTNLLKHAHGGKLTLSHLEGEQLGLEIETLDNGPGIADIEQAMTDGFSTTRSLGSGLGAINRLMNEFAITSPDGGGTRVVCRKWLRTQTASSGSCPLEFGAASRPHPRMDVNGDAFVICQWAESALAGVIDGLGHGPEACFAAQTAREFVENHFDLNLREMFLGAGRSCRDTRGVVMELARFDWGEEKLSFASVGDTEVRVMNRLQPFNFNIRRGIIGLNAPNAVVTEHPWTPENILVMHSDGLTSRWKWDDFPGITAKPADAIARELLRALARETDDATALVVRGASL